MTISYLLTPNCKVCELLTSSVTLLCFLDTKNKNKKRMVPHPDDELLVALTYQQNPNILGSTMMGPFVVRRKQQGCNK